MAVLRRLGIMLVLAGFLTGIFLFVTRDHEVALSKPTSLAGRVIEKVAEKIQTIINPNADIEPQPPLANPPPVVKAIYATNWSGGSEKKISYFLDLLNTTELNAIVLDIKDYTGMVAYEPDVALVKQYGAFEKRIPRINALIKRFHDAGVYVIGRMAVFQDGALVKARPDLAPHSKSTGGVWGDFKGVHWLDSASEEVWDYNVAIAQEALARGFDEINFDYIRFASDGNMADISYPFFNATSTLKQTSMKKFFKYLREKLPQAKLSADLFGYTTTNMDDLGIGQVIEDAFPYFDYIMPMTYPSHYNKGFLNLQNPAAYPYDVVKYCLDRALTRLEAFMVNTNAALSVTSTAATVDVPVRYAKIRPWVQDFNLGANYDPAKVRDQIRAIDEATVLANSSVPISELKNGWSLWNAANVYTREALMTDGQKITTDN